jgi:hypothetical protein
LIHARQVAVQRFHWNFLSQHIRVKARRLFAFPVHGEYLVHALNIQRIPSVLGDESEPHDLPENIGFLQRCLAFVCEQWPFDLRDMFKRLHVGLQLIVKAALQTAALP